LVSRCASCSTSRRALAIAGGVILLVISSMVLRSNEPTGRDRDSIRRAVFPLAVPYLLNPTRIAVLVIMSSEAKSLATLALALGLLAVVPALDAAVFRWPTR
jgi:small neutral amino acid transporter SnatA (MarC family)